jgi:dissimilatory sulfite reductase (desulfoviridin) alpha/beta subunit
MTPEREKSAPATVEAAAADTRLTAARVEELKAGGIIPQRQPGKVTIRCKAPGGRMTAERLERVAAVARRYGSGVVHLSVRQSAEIVGVDLHDLDAVARELAAVGQEIASCGKRVRVATACGGCEYNPNAWTDTQALAQAVTERFFGEETPHKFKITFAGCVRDCVRARAADLGFQGMAEPGLAAELCTHCGICLRACRDDALTMGADDLPARDGDRCISCGDCIRACPFDALVAARVGHAVFVGGRHGRHPHVAYPVAEFVADAQIADVVAATLAWYRQHGAPRERLGETLDRVGIDSYRRALRAVVGELLLADDAIRKPKWARLFYHGLAQAFPQYGEVGLDR